MCERVLCRPHQPLDLAWLLHRWLLVTLLTVSVTATRLRAHARCCAKFDASNKSQIERERQFELPPLQSTCNCSVKMLQHLLMLMLMLMFILMLMAPLLLLLPRQIIGPTGEENNLRWCQLELACGLCCTSLKPCVASG